jgi:cyclase
MSKDNSNHDMFLGASPSQFQMAKQLRHKETEAEKLLWLRLSRKQLGVKFRRQHPLHDFIADFYCHSHKLVIEIDGEVHDTIQSRSYDALRSKSFSDFGIETIRFSNDEVKNNIDHVLSRIRQALDRRHTQAPKSLKGDLNTNER